MLLLESVQLINFLSHEDTKITFEENESVLFDGVSGAGKSSIVEAIIWNFYGIARSNNTALIRSGADKARVVLITEKDGRIYRIDREISLSGKHTLSLQSASGDEKFVPVGVSGIKNVQSFIETDITGASYALFINSAASPQDNSENFTKQTAAKKKDIILEIIKASDYDKYYDKARDAIKERSNGVSMLEVEKRTKEESVRVDAEVTASLPALVKDERELRNRAGLVKNEIEKIQISVSENKIIKESIDRLVYEISSLRRQDSVLGAKVDKLAKEIKDLDTGDAPQLSDIELAGLSVLETEKAWLEEEQRLLSSWYAKKVILSSHAPSDLSEMLNEDIKNLNAKLIKVINSSPGACLLNHEHCPNVEKEHDKMIDDIAAELKTKQDMLTTNKSEIGKHLLALSELGSQPAHKPERAQAVDKQIKEIQAKKELINAYNQAKAGLFEKKNLFKDTSEEKLSTNKSILKIEEEKSALIKTLDVHLENDLITYQNQLKEMEQNLCTYVVKIDMANKTADRYKKFKEDIKTITDRISLVNDEISNLTEVKEAFGNNGIKAIMIDFILPQMEDNINEILSKVSDFRIRLETQKSSVSGDSLLEGLFITIINGQGETFDLNNYSGGEKVKISAAISEGLAGMQKIGFKIYDESFISLDDATVESFVEVITNIQERFKQIICISHIQAIKDIFPKQVTIVKKNGISSVK